MPPVLKTTSPEDHDMAKVKNLKGNMKGLLNQRVRFGLFSVPLWVAGAVYAARLIRDRRRRQVAV
jgi:hypothetical protein